eukprot:jgi/Mesvir1/25729/Mv01913-RA.1
MGLRSASDPARLRARAVSSQATKPRLVALFMLQQGGVRSWTFLLSRKMSRRWRARMYTSRTLPLRRSAFARHLPAWTPGGLRGLPLEALPVSGSDPVSLDMTLGALVVDAQLEVEARVLSGRDTTLELPVQVVDAFGVEADPIRALDSGRPILAPGPGAANNIRRMAGYGRVVGFISTSEILYLTVMGPGLSHCDLELIDVIDVKGPGQLTNVMSSTEPGSLLSFELLAVPDSALVLQVAAGACRGANGQPSMASEPFPLLVDFLRPSVVVTRICRRNVNSSTIIFHILFSEWVSGFSAEGIEVQGGSLLCVSPVSQANGTYEAVVEPLEGSELVLLSVKEGAAVDIAGNPSTASPVVNSRCVPRGKVSQLAINAFKAILAAVILWNLASDGGGHGRLVAFFHHLQFFQMMSLLDVPLDSTLQAMLYDIAWVNNAWPQPMFGMGENSRDAATSAPHVLSTSNGSCQGQVEEDVMTPGNETLHGRQLGDSADDGWRYMSIDELRGIVQGAHSRVPTYDPAAEIGRLVHLQSQGDFGAIVLLCLCQLAACLALRALCKVVWRIAKRFHPSEGWEALPAILTFPRLELLVLMLTFPTVTQASVFYATAGFDWGVLIGACVGAAYPLAFVTFVTYFLVANILRANGVTFRPERVYYVGGNSSAHMDSPRWAKDDDATLSFAAVTGISPRYHQLGHLGWFQVGAGLAWLVFQGCYVLLVQPYVWKILNAFELLSILSELGSLAICLAILIANQESTAPLPGTLSTIILLCMAFFVAGAVAELCYNLPEALRTCWQKARAALPLWLLDMCCSTQQGPLSGGETFFLSLPASRLASPKSSLECTPSGGASRWFPTHRPHLPASKHRGADNAGQSPSLGDAAHRLQAAQLARSRSANFMYTEKTDSKGIQVSFSDPSRRSTKSARRRSTGERERVVEGMPVAIPASDQSRRARNSSNSIQPICLSPPDVGPKFGHRGSHLRQAAAGRAPALSRSPSAMYPADKPASPRRTGLYRSTSESLALNDPTIVDAWCAKPTRDTDVGGRGPEYTTSHMTQGSKGPTLSHSNSIDRGRTLMSSDEKSMSRPSVAIGFLPGAARDGPASPDSASAGAHSPVGSGYWVSTRDPILPLKPGRTTSKGPGPPPAASAAPQSWWLRAAGMFNAARERESRGGETPESPSSECTTSPSQRRLISDARRQASDGRCSSRAWSSSDWTPRGATQQLAVLRDGQESAGALTPAQPQVSPGAGGFGAEVLATRGQRPVARELAPALEAMCEAQGGSNVGSFNSPVAPVVNGAIPLVKIRSMARLPRPGPAADGLTREPSYPDVAGSGMLQPRPETIVIDPAVPSQSPPHSAAMGPGANAIEHKVRRIMVLPGATDRACPEEGGETRADAAALASQDSADS